MTPRKLFGTASLLIAGMIPVSCTLSNQLLPINQDKPPRASSSINRARKTPDTHPVATEKYFSSIVWCVMENRGLKEVKDLSSHRYLAAHGATFANYQDCGHPSGPNYRIMVSGAPWTHGETFSRTEPTVATELQPVGVPTLDWKMWGTPDLKHDPYHDLLSPIDDRSGPFDPDQLPAHAQVYLGADDDNNAHDGPLSAVDRNINGLIKTLDKSKWFNTPDAQGRYPVLVVTWDESMLGDDRISTSFYGRGVKEGYASQTAYNHYNLCRTLTDNWGVAPLQDAANQPAISDVWK